MDELRSNLSPDAAELLKLQMESINLVQRHGKHREVCLYTRKWGKLQRNRSLAFPECSDELKFAVIKFATKTDKRKWTAEYYLVNGFLFDIMFSPGVKDIKNIDDIDIIKTDILHDPMEKVYKSEKQLVQHVEFSGWLGEWTRDHRIHNVYLPLSEDDRNMHLHEINAKLPEDYLELTKQCEGLMLDDISIYGLSEIYEAVLPKESYYVIAEINGKGVMTIRRHSDDSEIYYFEYGDETPVAMGSSIRDAVEKTIGE
jgi:hypothetical protein